MRQNEIYSGSFRSTVTSIFKSSFVAFWTSCGRIFLTRYKVVGPTCSLELKSRFDYQPLLGKGARGEVRSYTRERRKLSLVEIMYSVIVFSDSSPPFTSPQPPPFPPPLTSPFLLSPPLPSLPSSTLISPLLTFPHLSSSRLPYLPPPLPSSLLLSLPLTSSHLPSPDLSSPLLKSPQLPSPTLLSPPLPLVSL